MRDLDVSFPKPCSEEWESMTPVGRGRMCARCAKPVHDLSKYDFEEAEALLRSDPGTCVRACAGADGVVALKPGREDGRRRMVVAIAVSAGLLAAAPAVANQDSHGGAIAGETRFYGFGGRVIATDQRGKTFRARLSRGGRYRIGHLPAGIYSVTFVPRCGERWTVENVVVEEGRTVSPDSGEPQVCIVVGMLQIENGSG
jgi:hypothetical protein